MILKIFPRDFIAFAVIVLSLISCQGNQDSAPVLLLAEQDNFGLYTGEILRTEGFMTYEVKPVTDESISTALLNQYDVVVLAGNNLDEARIRMLQEYVSDGGTLIAFRPDRGLLSLFGIREVAGELKDGYMAIDTSQPSGKGLTGVPVQIHGNSQKYIRETGIMLAELMDTAGNRTGFPALVGQHTGSGVAYTFSYNLPGSVVLTRQGNPLSAGREMDGIHGLRAMDLFAGGWTDTSKNTVNQADVHMNLLSRCIENSGAAGKPMPRLWYFPDSLKSLVTLTNDGEYRNEADFEVQFSDLDSLGAEMTLYVLETNKVSREWSDKWSSRGFEISGHPDDTREAADPQWTNMANALAGKKKEITDLYGREMRTVANHWFVWCGRDSAGNPDFAAQAMIEEKHGLGMDVNYAHYDNGSTAGHFLGTPGYRQGNYNGSGLIMKFAGSNGKVLDIYQHLNNVYDQQYMELKDPEGFFTCFKGLLDRSLDHEIYSFISIKSHNDEYFFSKVPLARMITYASEHGIPVWTASRLLDFVKARDGVRFNDIKWGEGTLSFTLNSPVNCEGITFMVPVLFNGQRISRITADGEECDYAERTVRGKRYAFVTVEPGRSYVVEVRYRA